MRNLATCKVKARAHYTCQECGSTEYIQGHHERPGDDDSLIALCADCHSKKHPDLPRALFFNHTQQPYWSNKSASSLAGEMGVHSRTVIRAAKRLKIKTGELSHCDEELIKNNIPKLKWGMVKIVEPVHQPKPIRELRLTSEFGCPVTVPEASKQLGKPKMTLYRWIDSNKLIAVTFGGILFVPKSEVARLSIKASEERERA